MGIRHNVKVCSYLGEERKPDRSKVRIYDAPKEYPMSLNTLSGFTELQLFGDTASRTVKGVIDIRLGKGIKERDVAYLFGATSEGENAHGEKANYEVRQVLPQNVKTVVYFEKMNK